MKTIWINKEQEHEEIFLRARKSFSLAHVPENCRLKITCSGIYKLWINGAPVVHGPAHSGTQVKRVDELDVSKWLRTGNNLITVRSIHFSYCTAQGFCPAPALAAELSGENIFIETDSSWRLSIDSAFCLPSFRRNTMFGPQEIYDSGKEDDWLSLEYDDSKWDYASIVEKPWGEEIARGVPFPKEFEIKPVAVCSVAEVIDQEHFPAMWRYHSYRSLSVTLLQDVPEKPVYSEVRTPENLIGDNAGVMTVIQPSIRDASQPTMYCATVIFDFGREITGYTRFEVEGNAGAIVDTVCGELLTAGRVQAMRQGTHYADRYILKEGRQSHEVYDWKGFRYVQLTFRNLTRPLTLHKISTLFTSYPVQDAGQFRCAEDSLLEQIWNIGAYTQQLCMHDRLMDCPWREQVQWLGDGRLQLLIIQNAFGAADMMKKFLEDFASSQYDNGLIPSMSGRKDKNDIIDYALLWILALHDYALFIGDMEFIRRMLPHAEKVLVFFKKYINGRGLIEHIPGWVFIDWAAIGRAGCVAPLNGIYFMALKCAEEMSLAAGNKTLTEYCRREQKPVAENFHKTFWSEERQLYRDCISAEDSVAGNIFSQHTQAIAVLSGLSPVNAKELMSQAAADKNITEPTPYFSFYLLEALSAAGMDDEALAFIRKKWGNMLDTGATTFWEEWQPNSTYRDGFWVARPRSQCHAWSAAPTAWFSRYLLGVRQENIAGSLVFAPVPCGLKKMTGQVPTRYGDVQVFWEITGGKFSARLTLPAGCPEPAFRPPVEFASTAECTVCFAEK